MENDMEIVKGEIKLSELLHRLKEPDNYEWYCKDVHSGVVLGFNRMIELMNYLDVGYTIDYVNLMFTNIKWSK